jgi:hypothetical protein
MVAAFSVPVTAGQPTPPTSSLNFTRGRTRGNNAVLALGTAGQVEVHCAMPPQSSGSTHLVLDLFGYFR